MEVLDIIKEKAELLPKDIRLNIEAVITHLKAAEEHYNRGKELGDEQFFTDVIYRCNHAFEGVLREAFSVIAEGDPSTKTVYEIEQFFAEKTLFRKRVLDLFTRYRQDWRNPSTHDHKLFFSEGEALLALLNVQAFVAVVLDQIIEKTGYALGYKEAPMPNLAQADKPLLERVADLLQEFSNNEALWKEIAPDETTSPFGFFRQIEGVIGGFLASQAPDLDVEIEPEIAQRVRPDIVVSDGEQRIIVEIKGRYDIAYKNRGITHLSYMLAASDLREGILLFVPRQPTPLKREVEQIGSSLRMIVLFPSSLA